MIGRREEGSKVGRVSGEARFFRFLFSGSQITCLLSLFSVVAKMRVFLLSPPPFSSNRSSGMQLDTATRRWHRGPLLFLTPSFEKIWQVILFFKSFGQKS